MQNNGPYNPVSLHSMFVAMVMNYGCFCVVSGKSAVQNDRFCVYAPDREIANLT